MCTLPLASATTSFTAAFFHMRCTVESGTHPGPESMVTTVPTGPEVGLIVMVAAQFTLAVFVIPLVRPRAVNVWLPHTVTTTGLTETVPTALAGNVPTTEPVSSVTLTDSPAP